MNDKLRTPDNYNHVVRVEISDKEEELELYNVVLTHMIHGPCSMYNEQYPSMKYRRCKRNYPKSFSAVTTLRNDSYLIYRRRERGLVSLHNNAQILVDNSCVILYNLWLLLKYDCYINVKICSSITNMKYLYKHVYKGPVQVSFEVHPAPNYDEIHHFVDARWVCAPKALWKIFKFSMSRMSPLVERLQIHLPN